MATVGAAAAPQRDAAGIEADVDHEARPARPQPITPSMRSTDSPRLRASRLATSSVGRAPSRRRGAAARSACGVRIPSPSATSTWSTLFGDDRSRMKSPAMSPNAAGTTTRAVVDPARASRRLRCARCRRTRRQGRDFRRIDADDSQAAPLGDKAAAGAEGTADGGLGSGRDRRLRALRHRGPEERRAGRASTARSATPSDELLTGELGDVRLVFLPRHGRGHPLPPTAVNARANIDALKRAGCTDVHLALGGRLAARGAGARRLRGRRPVHRPHLRPREELLRPRPRRPRLDGRAGLPAALRPARPRPPAPPARGWSRAGRYLAMEGPQFSTKAESELYRSLGLRRDRHDQHARGQARPRGRAALRRRRHGHRLRLLARGVRPRRGRPHPGGAARQRRQGAGPGPPPRRGACRPSGAPSPIDTAPRRRASSPRPRRATRR